LDIRALMNLDRTPQVRQEVTVVGTDPVRMDVTVPGPPRN
jgi:hypothetical protein